MSLLWLAGDSGPPGSGVHEGKYGDYHTSTDLRLLEGAPQCFLYWVQYPLLEKSCLLLVKQLGSEVEAGYPGMKGV